MKPEIEAKFLDVDHTALRAKLEAVGAECVRPMRLMRRKNYDYPDGRLDREFDGWIRVRDEGGMVTLSYKQLNDRTLLGTHEVSVAVDDFDAACAFLESIGMRMKSYQETKRESWKLGSVEIELDEWPWIKSFMEMEGRGEQELKDVAAKLGFNWVDAKHGSVEIAYTAEYNVPVHYIDEVAIITFQEPLPQRLAESRRA